MESEIEVNTPMLRLDFSHRLNKAMWGLNGIGSRQIGAVFQVGLPELIPMGLLEAARHHQLLFADASCGGHIGWVLPLAPHPREPVIPSCIDPHRDTGTFILANADRSRSDLPYHATRLLVLEELPRPVPAYFQKTCLGNTLFLDRDIGDVPIEQDGSAYFTVPVDRELLFVLLDARGVAVKLKMYLFRQLKNVCLFVFSSHKFV